MPRKPNTTKKERYNDPFPTVLRKLIEEKGITQEELKEKLGVSTRQSVTGYIDGSTLPTIDKINALADLFDVSADYLLGRTPEKTSEVDLKAVYEDIGLSEEAVKAIRDIRKQNYSDGLKLLLENPSLDVICEHISKLANYSRDFISSGTDVKIERERAAQVQEGIPSLVVLSKYEAIEVELSAAERRFAAAISMATSAYKAEMLAREQVLRRLERE